MSFLRPHKAKFLPRQSHLHQYSSFGTCQVGACSYPSPRCSIRDSDTDKNKHALLRVEQCKHEAISFLPHTCMRSLSVYPRTDHIPPCVPISPEAVGPPEEHIDRFSFLSKMRNPRRVCASIDSISGGLADHCGARKLDKGGCGQSPNPILFLCFVFWFPGHLTIRSALCC